MPFRDHFFVKSKLMDAICGPILRCVDVRQQQEVAVKVVVLGGETPTCPSLNQRPSEDPRKEMQVIERLRATGGHPNVVHYQDILEEEPIRTSGSGAISGGILLFVMEFCAKGDLLDLMSQRPDKRLDEHEALGMFKQIVSGVQFLHDNGIAHRDLSLENVLVNDANVPKVCDFGLSVDIKANRLCHDQVGKCYYMAPEVVAGKAFDPVLADIWSLGMILFIMLTSSPLCELAQEDCLTIEIVKRHGVGKILQFWGAQWVASPTTIDLINQMLQVTPSERLPLDQVLRHPAFDSLEKKRDVSTC